MNIGMNDEGKFWMVWNPKGYSPQVKHGSECEAAAEARRLAAKQPQDAFYVVAAMQKVTAKVQVVTTPLFDQAWCNAPYVRTP